MNETSNSDFTSIRLRLASAEDVRAWSHGEVTRPETINYRTQKPEKDGLFDEKIFGPSKDWECYCGKYKKIRYKGIVCDKCGVEVTRSIVRRERFGHIELAASVTHIWFLRGLPSKVGLALDLSVQALEKVVYFANFIVTKVSEDRKEEALKQIDQEATEKRKMIQEEYQREAAKLKQQTTNRDEQERELINLSVMRDERMKDLDEAVHIARRELRDLKPLKIITESQYHDLSLKYGHIFEAGIGAEALRELLKNIDVNKVILDLEVQVKESGRSEKNHLIRRLRFFKNLRKNNIRPECMVLMVIPVIPPELRPMVQLDGGRFATSDLNDLYRRIINRNNRLKRLKELNAPEVIQRNEKRMLQEAVDALIDNSARHGKTTTASTGQRRMLKSLADMLKGKQGRFRQNLLGKRVDYSGRSVIVVGPHLKIDQCGIPKKMALELFRPFVISRLIQREYVYNVRSANRFIEEDRAEVWDILEEIVSEAHVLLNRAPTLHRLSIQAFRPILIEGKAIQIHPLVCPPFNADFDGDQMAIHVPLTEEAKKEARDIMLSAKNLLKPATGEPVSMPSQDIILGTYYMTMLLDNPQGREHVFSSEDEAVLSWSLGHIDLRTKIKIRISKKLIETSIGRVFFNRILPENQRFMNVLMDKKKIREVISRCFVEEGQERTVELLDAIKDIGIEFITRSGMSWGIGDTPIPSKKKPIIDRALLEVETIRSQYEMGLLTDEERRMKVIETWTRVKNEVTKMCQEFLDKKSSTFLMIDSGARGSLGQVTQMMGMKGLVINPAGETIELPVTASFKEGFNVLEYFISSHGTRKGLTDTALRTANAGYLTRRLVDVAQDVVITEEDCGIKEGIFITREESEEMGEPFVNRLMGRVVAKDVKNASSKVVFKKGACLLEKDRSVLEKLKVEAIEVRSVLICKTLRGACALCYGYDLGYNRPVSLGTAVGIIAAQSIGEPGTQLTMRTFHTGGVAGQDITQGLPRVEELFEARPLKRSAALSDVDGEVIEVVGERNQQRIIRVRYNAKSYREFTIVEGAEVRVKNGDAVVKGDTLIGKGKGSYKIPFDGVVKIKGNILAVSGEEDKVHEYEVPAGVSVLVKPGDLVTRGAKLSEGHIDLHRLYVLQGREAVQKYVLKEIQYIYSSQGQKLNDKHIEIMIRQMFSRYVVKDGGDTELVPGEMITIDELREANEGREEREEKSAQAENVLLGITRISLTTDSFLAAASFQETARVLIDAAITGKVDHLRGLKENVIIGRLVGAGTGFKKESAS